MNNQAPFAPSHIPVTESARPLQKRSGVRTFGTILWALMPLLTFSFAAPGVFVHVAIRVTTLVSILSAAFYVTVFVFTWGILFTVQPENGTVLFEVSFIGFLILWIGATTHACLIRGSFWAQNPLSREPAGRVFSAPPAVPRPDPPAPAPNTSHSEAAHSPMKQVQVRQQQRMEARALILADPMLAKELGVGRPEQSGKTEDGGLIDFNHASVESMARLPGISSGVAQEIRDRVRQVGPFASLGEVMLEIEIDPTHLAQLEEFSVFLP